jgi:hypothetical protein
MRSSILIRGGPALLALATFFGPGEARAQTYAVPSNGAAWGAYQPASPWTGYAPGYGWVGYAPTASARPPAPSGWTYSTPPNAWTGYAPQTAWTGYVPQGGWVVTPRRSDASRGYGTVNGRVTAAYREFGSGRPVPLHKPWLPGSP